MKKLIFGLGTGRCGTVSLSTLLNQQKGANITHEFKPVLPWEFSQHHIDEKLENNVNRKEKYVGDVAFYYLPYVNYIISKYTNVNFICLKRDKKQVIDSYLRKTKGRNHWINHYGALWRSDPVWDKCYPNYKTFSKRKGIGKYWNYYYRQIRSLRKNHPDNVIITDMNKSLNTREGVLKLLNFAGFKNKDRIVTQKIKKNAL